MSDGSHVLSELLHLSSVAFAGFNPCSSAFTCSSSVPSSLICNFANFAIFKLLDGFLHVFKFIFEVHHLFNIIIRCHFFQVIIRIDLTF